MSINFSTNELFLRNKILNTVKNNICIERRINQNMILPSFDDVTNNF